MARPLSNDLNYGHPGRAVFNLESRTWDFGRRFGQRGVLNQLGSWKTVLAAAIRFDRAVMSEAPRSIRNTQRSVRALIRNNPELAPSTDLLPEICITSAAVT